LAQEKKLNILGKFPWLPYATGGFVLSWILFAAFSMIQYQNGKTLHTATIAQVASDKPTTGQYKVTGGALNYTFAEAVGYSNDHDKDAGEDFTSYVPYIDPRTLKVVMLVQLEHYSPKDFVRLVDDMTPQQQIGEFIDPNTVDPRLYAMFDDRRYPISRDTPVLVQFGAPVDPKSKIVMTGIATLLLSGGLWSFAYLKAKPKTRRKSFSERYPDRRVY
jgi:hypothetical protein